MAEESKSVFNFEKVEQNVSGDGSVGQIGENKAEVNNQFGERKDWRPPFMELAEQVSDKQWPEETTDVIVGRYETPSLAVAAAVEEIEQDLARDDVIGEDEFQERRKTWSETFHAMIPIGVKITSSVGMALAQHFTKKTAAGVAAEAFFSTIGEINS